MAIKFEVESLEGLDDGIKGLYKEVEGKYQLDVEGAAPKQKLNEFRENNVNLLKELDTVKSKLNKLDGFDIDAFNNFVKNQQDTKEQQLIKAGKIDELVEHRSEAMKNKYENDLKSLNDKFSLVSNKLQSTLIDGELAKVAASIGVKPTAIDDVLLRGKQLFTLTEDGNVVAKVGDQVRFNSENKPYNISDFMGELSKSAPHLFAESSGGGQNNLKANNGIDNVKTVSRQDKKSWDIDAINKGKMKIV